MCIFSIFVDKGIQSLRDDRAVVGERISIFSFNYVAEGYCDIKKQQKASHFVVSTGLGSKFPSASTDAFFSVLEE